MKRLRDDDRLTSTDFFWLVGIFDDDRDDQSGGIGVRAVRIVAEHHERIDRSAEVAKTRQAKWIVFRGGGRLGAGHEVRCVIEIGEEFIALPSVEIVLRILIVLEERENSTILVVGFQRFQADVGQLNRSIFFGEFRRERQNFRLQLENAS